VSGSAARGNPRGRSPARNPPRSGTRGCSRPPPAAGRAAASRQAPPRGPPRGRGSVHGRYAGRRSSERVDDRFRAPLDPWGHRWCRSRRRRRPGRVRGNSSPRRVRRSRYSTSPACTNAITRSAPAARAARNRLAASIVSSHAMQHSPPTAHRETRVIDDARQGEDRDRPSFVRTTTAARRIDVGPVPVCASPAASSQQALDQPVPAEVPRVVVRGAKDVEPGVVQDGDRLALRRGEVGLFVVSSARHARGGCSRGCRRRCRRPAGRPARRRAPRSRGREEVIAPSDRAKFMSPTKTMCRVSAAASGRRPGRIR